MDPEPIASAQPEPWRLLAGPGILTFEFPASSIARRRLGQELGALPAGTTFVMRVTGWRSRWRLRGLVPEARLDVLREYVAVPSAAAPTFYVENSPGAFRYFFSRLLTLPRGGAVRSAALTAAQAVSGLLPLRALVGTVVPTRIVLGRIALKTGVAGLEPKRPVTLLDVGGMETVVLALSKDPNAKVTVLMIPRGATEPALAAKVATTDAAQASVATERRVLIELQSGPAGGLPAGIPKVVDLPGMQGVSALVTTALPGSPMSARYHRWRHLATRAAVEADFRAAERWLAHLHRATAVAPAPTDIFSAGAEIAARRFADQPRLEEVIERLRAVHGRLRTASTPRTVVHGDFWFGNLMWKGDAISGVVDWEFGSSSGEPLRDLVRFAVSFALYLDRHTTPGGSVTGHRGLRAGEWGAGIVYCFDGEGWFPDLFRKFIKDGMARLGADPGLWRDAALAGLAEIAATADHLGFARLHWELFERLALPDLIGAEKA